MLFAFLAFDLGVEGLRTGVDTAVEGLRTGVDAAWRKHLKDRQDFTRLSPLQLAALAGSVVAFGGLAVQHGVPEAILNLLGKQCLCLIYAVCFKYLISS